MGDDAELLAEPEGLVADEGVELAPIELTAGNESPGISPTCWPPLSIRASGERLTMSPKAGTVTASRTIASSAAIGRPRSRHCRGLVVTMSRSATAVAINAGLIPAASVAPAQPEIVPITISVTTVSIQPPGSKTPVAPVDPTAFPVSAPKV